VVAVAIVEGLVTALLGTAGLGRTPFGGAADSSEVARQALAAVPALSLAGLVGGLVSLVAGWVLNAIAVAGLRGRPITAEWVLGAGLRAFAAGLLIAIVALLAVVAYGLLAILMGGLLLVTLVILVPIVFYLAIRLLFWTLAIFDGAGVIDGFHVAWDLSRGSVLRMLGWGLLVALLGFGVSLIGGAFTLATGGIPAIATAISQGLTLTFTMFSTITMAVLYESQRWRMMPPPPLATPPPAVPATDPFAPPPPPMRLPGDPWGAPPPSSSPGSDPG
jgi:hypothetical protein